MQTNEPAAWAKPYILDNLQQTQQTYQQNQPQLQGYASQQQNTYGRLAPGAEAGISGAQSLVNNNLSGANLGGNPYLEGIISKTRRDVSNDVNGMFNAAGRFGSGANQGILADRLAEAENGLRFQNYSTERGYQQNAIGDAQSLMGGATGLLNNAAQLPWVGVQAQNGGTNSLTNGYGVKTTTENPGLLSTIGQVAKTAGQVAGTAGMFLSDGKTKNIGKQVGMSPDGLPLYDFTYKGDPAQTPQVGPVAQEVAQVRPDAVSQAPGGLLAVDYGKLGLPAPGDMADLRQNVPAIKKQKLGLIGTLKDDPTLSKPENASRLFWTRLAAASGSPLGEAVLGGAYDTRKQEQGAQELDIRRQQIDNRDPRTGNQKDLEAAGLKPGTPEYNRALLGAVYARQLPSGYQMGPDNQPGPMPGYMTPQDKDRTDFQQQLALADRTDARAAAAQAAQDRRFLMGLQATQARANAPAKLRPLPLSAATGIQGNLEAMRKIDDALAALDKTPNAVGFSNMLTPDAILQRIDPGGVGTRGKIGELGAVKIHDLSGAAVSASEAPRFTPFVPSVNDSPATAKKKLQNFRSALQAQLSEQQDFYSDANGYQSYRTPGAAAAANGPAWAGKGPMTPTRPVAKPAASGGWSIQKVK